MWYLSGILYRKSEDVTKNGEEEECDSLKKTGVKKSLKSLCKRKKKAAGDNFCLHRGWTSFIVYNDAIGVNIGVAEHRLFEKISVITGQVNGMKRLSLLLWVTQFGLSVLFPLCFFLILASWLQKRFALGLWIVIVLGILGFLTSVSTARSCIRSMMKDAEEAGDSKKPPLSFNDHD